MRIGGMGKRYIENLCPSILEHMCGPHGVCNGLDVPYSCNFCNFYLFFLSLSLFDLNLNLEFLQTPKRKIFELLDFAIGCGPHLFRPCFGIHAHWVFTP